MKNIGNVTMDEFTDAQNDLLGWCTHCLEFTRDQTEGDAEGYGCPVCRHKDTVVGAEQAMLLGYFNIIME